MSDQDDDTATAPRKTRKVAVKQWIDEKQLKQDLSYTMSDISGAMMDQASLLAHYGVLSAKASRQVDDMKMLLENAEAAVDRKIRDEKAKAGEKVTEPMLEKLVARHPQVIEVKKALNEAKQIEAIGKIAVEAFKNRKDMLVQHGSRERAELEGEVRLGLRNMREEQVEGLKNRVMGRQRSTREAAENPA
jgi:hypothetical protein